MKTFKIIGSILWVISALMAGLGLITSLEPDTVTITKLFIYIFLMTFTTMTPLYIYVFLKDSFWKTQTEIENLRLHFHKETQKAIEARNKLIEKILEYEPKKNK